jgi:hypothetical protein
MNKRTTRDARAEAVLRVARVSTVVRIDRCTGPSERERETHT